MFGDLLCNWAILTSKMKTIYNNKSKSNNKILEGECYYFHIIVLVVNIRQNTVTSPNIYIKFLESVLFPEISILKDVPQFYWQKPEVFCKKTYSWNFSNFTGKHLCQSHFLNKVSKFLRTAFLTKHLQGFLLYWLYLHPLTFTGV